MRDVVFSTGEIIKEAIVPPLPIKKGRYRCEKTFVLDDLVPLFETHKKLGIVLVGGEDAEIWVREHTRCVRIADTSMHRQKAQKKGGQSAPRFQRMRLNQINEFVKKAADLVMRMLSDIDDIVIAGHGELYMEIAKTEGIASKVRQIITIDVLTIENVCERITAAPGTTASCAVARQLLDGLDKMDAHIIYGLDVIRVAVESNMVARIVMLDDVDIAFEDAIKIAPDSPEGRRIQMMGGALAELYY